MATFYDRTLDLRPGDPLVDATGEIPDPPPGWPAGDSPFFDGRQANTTPYPLIEGGQIRQYVTQGRVIDGTISGAYAFQADYSILTQAPNHGARLSITTSASSGLPLGTKLVSVYGASEPSIDADVGVVVECERVSLGYPYDTWRVKITQRFSDGSSSSNEDALYDAANVGPALVAVLAGGGAGLDVNVTNSSLPGANILAPGPWFATWAQFGSGTPIGLDILRLDVVENIYDPLVLQIGIPRRRLTQRGDEHRMGPGVAGSRQRSMRRGPGALL